MTDSSTGPSLAPRFDTFDNVPEYDALRRAFDASDWPTFEAEMLRMPAEEQSQAMLVFAEHPGRVDKFLTSAERDHPQSPVAATALAIRRIVVGWEFRTKGDASEVSTEQFEEFWKYLRFGERALIEVCAIHPDYIPAWTARILTARGLQLGKSEGYRRFRRRPDTHSDFSAQIAFQQFIEPKWFGTRDEADSFARTTAASAPEGSNSGALVAIMHLEHWGAVGGASRGQALLKEPGVIDELRGTAARSVLHPAHRFSPLSIVAHSAFLLVFWLADEPLEAVPHLEALGDRASRFPLEYIGDDPQALPTVWREVRAAADAATESAS